MFIWELRTDFVARCSLSVEGRVLNTVCFSGEREGERDRMRMYERCLRRREEGMRGGLYMT